MFKLIVNPKPAITKSANNEKYLFLKMMLDAIG